MTEDPETDYDPHEDHTIRLFGEHGDLLGEVTGPLVSYDDPIEGDYDEETKAYDIIGRETGLRYPPIVCPANVSWTVYRVTIDDEDLPFDGPVSVHNGGAFGLNIDQYVQRYLLVGEKDASALSVALVGLIHDPTGDYWRTEAVQLADRLMLFREAAGHAG